MIKSSYSARSSRLRCLWLNRRRQHAEAPRPPPAGRRDRAWYSPPSSCCRCSIRSRAAMRRRERADSGEDDSALCRRSPQEGTGEAEAAAEASATVPEGAREGGGQRCGRNRREDGAGGA
jgi:hypothetical protein